MAGVSTPHAQPPSGPVNCWSEVAWRAQTAVNFLAAQSG